MEFCRLTQETNIINLVFVPLAKSLGPHVLFIVVLVDFVLKFMTIIAHGSEIALEEEITNIFSLS